jgi:peptidoglycan hydrolase CwlO-like protein
MSEARKIFPMDTFVAYLKGDGSASVAEMLGYLTQKDLDTESVPFAAALAKAWIYEQHPELTKMSKGQMVELGQSVSVAPMPVKAKAEVDEVFAKLADYKGQIKAKDAKIEDLNKALAAKDGEIAALAAKVKEFEGQKKGEAEALFVTTEARIVEFTGKLEALLKEVEEVKKTGVVVAGVAGVAAAGAAPAADGGAGAPAEAVAGDDFGFSGGAQDPFADSKW